LNACTEANDVVSGWWSATLLAIRAFWDRGLESLTSNVLKRVCAVQGIADEMGATHKSGTAYLLLVRDAGYTYQQM
jgi:hypothetical protein